MLPFKVFLIALSSAIIPITVGSKNITVNAPTAQAPIPQYPPFPVPFPGLMPGAPGVPPMPYGTPLMSPVPGTKSVSPLFPPFFPGMFPPFAPPPQSLIPSKLPKGSPTPVAPPLPFGPFPPLPLPPGAAFPPVGPLPGMVPPQPPPPPPPNMIPTYGPAKLPMSPLPMPSPAGPIPISPLPMTNIPLATMPVPQRLPILPLSDSYYCSAFASIAVSQATSLKSATNFGSASKDSDIIDAGLAGIPDLLTAPLNAPIESRQYCRYTAVTSPAACTTCCQAAAHFGLLNAERVKGLLLLFDSEKPAVSNIDVGAAARKKRTSNLFPNGASIPNNSEGKKRYQCMCCAPRIFIDYQY